MPWVSDWPSVPSKAAVRELCLEESGGTAEVISSEPAIKLPMQPLALQNDRWLCND